MTKEPSRIERLAFIKHIHRKAEAESRKPSPYADTSILGFHDAVELFLQLASEEVNANGDQAFLAYWDDISKHSSLELTRKASMKRMKDARVSLKHHGNRPQKDDLESYRSEVRAFFEENTPKVFDVDYSDVSLVYLIEFDDAREIAEEIENHIEEGEFSDAIRKAPLAYDELFDEFDDRVRDQLGYSPFPSPRSRLSASTLVEADSEIAEVTHSKQNLREADDLEDELALTVAKVEEDVETLTTELNRVYDRLKMMTLGVDFRRYQRFDTITPRISSGGHPLNPYWEEKQFSTEEARFARDFVVEVALTLQELPLDFEAELPTQPSLTDW